MAIPTIADLSAIFRTAFLNFPGCGSIDNAGLTAFCDAIATGLFEYAPGMTDEGGVTAALLNKTGAASIKGTLVEPSSSTNFAFTICGAGSYDPIGVVYDDGVADGDTCRIVVAGVADILLEDSLGSAREDWLRVSDTDAGRIFSDTAPSGGFPNVTAEHFREVGHSLQTVTGGTSKIVRAIVHFN